MTAGQPLVSIGLPTYNRADTLRRAVESVLAQDYANIELFICDNASADGTQTLCEEYVRRDPRVRYVRHEVNRGPNASFIRTLTETRGEFYMWLADDDWLDPTYVSHCVEFLLAHPDHQLVCGRARYYRGDRFCFDEEPTDLQEESPAARVLSYYRDVGMNGPFFGIMRREVATRLPVYRMLAGDWLFVAQSAFLGKVRTLTTTRINRSLEGDGSDNESLARRESVYGFWKRHIHLNIAFIVFRDIAWGAEVFRALGAPARWLLGLRSALGVARRHSLPQFAGELRGRRDRLRSRLILRTRLRRLLGMYRHG